MLRGRLMTAAVVSGILAAGLAASAVTPADAVIRAIPQGTAGTCPTVLANATRYARGTSGQFVPQGTVYKGDIWASGGIPDIDGFTWGADRTAGHQGFGWILETTPMGAPWVSCTLP